MPPSNVVSVDKDSRFCSNLMQNDDLPDTLGPLMMRVKGCLNRIYSHMTDLAVLQTPNISDGDGRVVTEALTLKERDSIKL